MTVEFKARGISNLFKPYSTLEATLVPYDFSGSKTAEGGKIVFHKIENITVISDNQVHAEIETFATIEGIVTIRKQKILDLTENDISAANLGEYSGKKIRWRQSQKRK